VVLFENVLLEHGIIDEEIVSKMREVARQKAIEARKKVLADPLPDPTTVEQGVYAD
jgi:acetoin:2,6-dichlorophenolindophenol oxidoreductase subunit alpha